MSDIDKIQLIHDIQKTFKYSDDAVSKLIEQIEDLDKKNNIARFFRGYTIEDTFQYLITALPWVRLAHKLDQTQLPLSSKAEFQVSDYQLYYEDFDKKCHPSLIEVKSVTGKKRILKVRKKQAKISHSYAKISKHPFLYAIFWENWNSWTLNTIDQFEEKSSVLKIDIETALKDDLSVIYGNVTYYIPPLKRIAIFDSSIQDTARIQHGEYGTAISDKLTKDGINFIDLTPMDSSVIDSFIQMRVISVKEEGNITHLIEESNSTYMLKVLSIVTAHIALMGEALDKEKSRHSFFFVNELMEKMNFQYSFSIPSKNSTMSYELYRVAFENTTLLDTYEKTHGIKNV